MPKKTKPNKQTRAANTPNDMLTRKEAAAVLTVSLSTFDRYVRAKRIYRWESGTGEGKRAGRRGPMYLFRRGDLDALATALKAPVNKQAVYLDILTRALGVSRTLLKISQRTIEEIPRLVLADRRGRTTRLEEVDAEIAALERETALYFGDVKRKEAEAKQTDGTKQNE